MSAGDAAEERAAFPDEVLLADELGEVTWAHARREGLPFGRRLEECLGSSASGPPGGWHGLKGDEPGGIGDEPDDQEEDDQRATHE